MTEEKLIAREDIRWLTKLIKENEKTKKKILGYIFCLKAERKEYKEELKEAKRIWNLKK